MEEHDSEEALMCTCGICMDIFYEPVTLPCGHSYCFTCLYALERTKSLSLTNRRDKRCPVCRERWQTWPKTSLVLNDLINHRFPGRRKRAEEDLIAETEGRRKELEKILEEGSRNKKSIMMEEGRIFIIAILVLALMLWKTKNTYLFA